MITSRKHSVVSIVAVSILFQCSSAAPQYFQKRSFDPLNERTVENAMADAGVADSITVTHPDYYNYQGNEFISDKWFAANALPSQESSNNFWAPEVSDSLIPPVYAETQFSSVVYEPINQPLSIQKDFANEFERGRADIDPDEDEEEFGGYFYPRPKVPFDLPHFKPLSASADVGESAKDEKVVTTTAIAAEESTEKTTTTSGPGDKV